jgi:putative membrane protein
MKPTSLLAFAMTVAATGCAKDSIDQDFVTKAGQGGLAEVEAGRIAAAKGVRGDVKTFGQRMVSDHSRANDELKSIATAASITVPSEPSSEEHDTITQLGAESGGDFDKAYTKAMVKDHKGDIDLFRKEASSGQNAELRAFAQKTLPALEEHLRMAEALNSNK